MILPTAIYPLSNAGIASPIFFLTAQIILLIAYFKNMESNKWRDDFSIATLFKICGTCSRILCGLVMLTMWILPKALTLWWIKLLTWIFVAAYTLDLLLISGEFLARILYLVEENNGRVKFKEFKPIHLSVAEEKYIPIAQRTGGKKSDRHSYDRVNANGSKSNKIHPVGGGKGTPRLDLELASGDNKLARTQVQG
jgi:hypothetical protein